jgi:hypothetical protein
MITMHLLIFRAEHHRLAMLQLQTSQRAPVLKPLQYRCLPMKLSTGHSRVSLLAGCYDQCRFAFIL